MTEKHARDLNPQEREAKLREIRRAAETPPQKELGETTKRAKDMSDAERSEWLREHKKRFNQ